MATLRSTVRQLIYWEYAKLIAGQTLGDRTSYGFVNATYQRLVQVYIVPATILAENQRLFQAGDVCAYCGSTNHLHWEHIIPLALNGPDTFDNMVRACRTCNTTKGARDPYQWYATLERIDEIPRIVLGKLLKILFAEYDRRGLLDDPAYMRSQDVSRVTLSLIFSSKG